MKNQALKHLSAFVAIAFSLNATATIAATVTINFDNDSFGNPINAPTLFANATQLTTLYSPLGVTFSGPGENDGGAILNQDANFGVNAHSGVNFLAFGGDLPRGPETIVFATPVNSVSAFVGGTNSTAILEMQAFNAADQLVGTDTKSPVLNNWVELAIVGSQITRVTLNRTFSGGAWLVDDLTFNPVPEPSTFILLAVGAGLTAISALRRRRRMRGPGASLMRRVTRYLTQATAYTLSLAALILCHAAVSQASSLVGVNFSAAESHPTNWTPLPSVISPANNLMAEDGSVTTIDLSFAFASLFSGTIDAGTVPIHTPSLAPLDGNAYNGFNGGSFLALYSDLAPNQDYYLWILGARFIRPISQHVQIFGSGAPMEFDQVGPANSLFLNDQLGDSTRTLESYAKIVNASDGGTITIVVKGISTTFGQTYTVSALAIQAVPEPGSLALAGIGLAALAGSRYRRERKNTAATVPEPSIAVPAISLAQRWLFFFHAQIRAVVIRTWQPCAVARLVAVSMPARFLKKNQYEIDT